MHSSSPFRVLFVCMGGLCRSPAAEAVLNARIESLGLQDQLETGAAACNSSFAGKPPEARMVTAATKRGYHLRSESTAFCPDDYLRYDLILVMNNDIRRDIEALDGHKAHRGKIRHIGDYIPALDGEDVPDPFDGGPEDFDRTLDLFEMACDAILRETIITNTGG